MAYWSNVAENIALVDWLQGEDLDTLKTTPIYGTAQLFGCDGTIDTPCNQAFLVLMAKVMDGSDYLILEIQQDTVSTFDSGNAKLVLDSDGNAKSASPGGDNKQCIMNLRAEELDNANGFNYWRYKISSTDDATMRFGLMAFLADGKYGPASDFDLSTVTLVK